MEHEILIEAELERDELWAGLLRETISAALAAEGVAVPCEVDVLLTDDEGIHQINLEQRGVDAPTDVLSFECDGVEDELSDMVPAGFCDVYELGDVVIAPDVAERQTHEFGTTFEQEVSLLFVHGLLHLCGYDHIVEEDAKVMEALEDEILAAWNAR